MKRCRKCEKRKRRKQFAKHRATCRACIAAAMRLFRASSKGKAKRKGERRRRLQRNRAAYQAIKRAFKCLFCPEREPCCIDFHHLDKAAKRRALPDSLLCSLKRIIEEISKCVALCSNCHRKVSNGILKLPADTEPISADLLWYIVKTA